MTKPYLFFSERCTIEVPEVHNGAVDAEQLHHHLYPEALLHLGEMDRRAIAQEFADEVLKRFGDEINQNGIFKPLAQERSWKKGSG